MMIDGKEVEYNDFQLTENEAYAVFKKFLSVSVANITQDANLDYWSNNKRMIPTPTQVVMLTLNKLIEIEEQQKLKSISASQDFLFPQ